MTLQRKPKAVCIGGGTGLPVILKALESLCYRVAVVNMVDDGRSSGILRRKYRIPPVGDLRNSLVELAGEKELAEIFNYRFDHGPLYPHPVGNIVIAAYLVSRKEKVSKALKFFSDLLKIDGKVLPACDEIVELVALTKKNRVVRGQVNVSHTRGIQRVWLEPPVKASSEVLKEIETADYIVIAPGSLYSSILPVFMTGEIGERFKASKAKKIWVFNLANEKNETYMYRSRDYVKAMKMHVNGFKVDYVLVARQPKKFTKPYRLVKLNIKDFEEVSSFVWIDDFVNENEPFVHDHTKLKAVFKKIIQ